MRFHAVAAGLAEGGEDLQPCPFAKRFCVGLLRFKGQLVKAGFTDEGYELFPPHGVGYTDTILFKTLKVGNGIPGVGQLQIATHLVVDHPGFAGLVYIAGEIDPYEIEDADLPKLLPGLLGLDLGWGLLFRLGTPHFYGARYFGVTKKLVVESTGFSSWTIFGSISIYLKSIQSWETVF